MNTAIIVATVLGLGFVIALLAIAILKFAGRLTRSLTSDEEQLIEAQCRRRLGAPQFDELRRRLRSPVPDDLRRLYAQREIIELSDVIVWLPGRYYRTSPFYFQIFLPADCQTLDEARFDLGANRFPFAVDVFHNYFFVNIGPEPSRDPAVYHLDCECDTMEKVAASVQEFTEALRAAAAP